MPLRKARGNLPVVWTAADYRFASAHADCGDIGDAPIPVGMSEDDFNLLLETLQLWKKKIVRDDYHTYHGRLPEKDEAEEDKK